MGEAKRRKLLGTMPAHDLKEYGVDLATPLGQYLKERCCELPATKAEKLPSLLREAIKQWLEDTPPNFPANWAHVEWLKQRVKLYGPGVVLIPLNPSCFDLGYLPCDRDHWIAKPGSELYDVGESFIQACKPSLEAYDPKTEAVVTFEIELIQEGIERSFEDMLAAPWIVSLEEVTKPNVSPLNRKERRNLLAG